YTAASLVSENRGLCWPASADSIPSSAGQEDHVSMGATSARRAASILSNSELILAIEALSSAQGLDLRGLPAAPGTGAALASVREVSAHVDEDRSLSPDVMAASDLLAAGGLISGVERRIGEIA
ncbi:MAG: aromatic amino acid lyase, partial [Actinobacteria bacterium]|nr:aromatic amino acid lyase [Actinomycetota bacterium]